MKRYSRKVREEAALICAIAASNQDIESYSEVCDLLGWKLSYGQESFELAVMASYEAYDAASAEALIRTGWSP